MDLIDRYNQALEYFSNEGNLLAIQICKLGYPAESNYISTAAVEWDDVRKKVKFVFNKKFQEKLTDEEFRFVLTHEAIHLLNEHIPFLKKRIDKMKAAKQSNEEISKFIKKFNFAADCVVNDSLVNIYGLKKVVDVPTSHPKIPRDKLIYGPDYAGMECHDLGVMDVYNMIPDEKVFGSGDTIDIHDWSSFFESDGSIKKDFVNNLSNFIKKNIENSSLSDEELEKLEKIKKQLEKAGLGNKAGNETLGQIRPVDGMLKTLMNWNKFFFELVEKKKLENVWNKPNRKLISVYPDILIPSVKNEEKEDIFIAIDSSGSIDRNALSLFVSVVKNIPKNFTVKAISFDTKCYEWDHTGTESPRGGGGTNFQIIEDWIQSNLKKYPKAIFCLTDGEGSPIEPQHPDRWCFILYGTAYDGYCKNMKRFNIKDLIK